MRTIRFNKAFKALAAFVLAAALFVGDALCALAASNVTIKEASVRVRQSASTDSTQLGSVKQGTSYDVLETVSDSSGAAWYKIKYDGTNVGYIRADMAVDSTSDEATKLKDGAATTTATPTPTATAAATATPTATPTPAPTQAAPTVDTNVQVAVSTQVTDVNPVSATVNNNTVNVRGEAGADSGRVTTVNKNTAVTVVGQAQGNDGKIWYLTNFTYDNKDVKGFIRSDFLSVSGEITEVAPEIVEEEPVVEEESAEPEPVVPQDYELKYETDEEGNSVWYLYDNTEGTRRSKLSTILESAEAYTTQKDKGSLSGKAKIIIIIMAIFLVLMALAITLLIFRIRDLEYDDEEDYDSYGRDRDREPRTVRPAGQRPVGARPDGRPAGQRPVGARPDGRPAGQRPAGARPEGRPVRPDGRPAGQRPEGARPEGRPVRPEGARPEGRPAGQRPEGARPEGRPVRPEGARPEGRPVDRHPSDSMLDAENPKAPKDGDWKPKNLAENDDFEFEFLNKWDEDDK